VCIMHPMSALQNCGKTQQELADLLDVHQTTISRWITRRVPADRVLEVARKTRISRKRLRPDLYGAT